MGLVRVYQTALQHFAWFDQVPNLDWDKAFQEYLPIVEKGQDLLSYYRTLQRFIALLEDGHTEVLLPAKLTTSRDNLPVVVDYVEEHYVVVERLPSQDILGEDIPPGSILLSVNGQDPEEWLRTHVFPFVCNPAMQAKRLAFNSIGCFSKGERVHLDLQYPDGRVASRIITANRDETQWNAELRNQFLRPWNRTPRFRTEAIGKQTVYIKYGACASDVEEQFCKYMQSLDKSEVETIILDLRCNPGGDTPERSIQQLLTKPLINPVIMRTRCSISCLDAGLALLRQRGASQQAIEEEVEAAVKRGDLPKGYSPGWYKTETRIGASENGYGGRLLVLINGETGSAAEEFTAILRAREHTTIIGEPSSGSTGTPIYFSLPGGGQVRVCTLRVCYPNGETYIGRGITPDVRVDRSIGGIAQGRDEVMERALSVAESASAGE